jgi:hypothetical protein
MMSRLRSRPHAVATRRTLVLLACILVAVSTPDALVLAGGASTTPDLPEAAGLLFAIRGRAAVTNQVLSIRTSQVEWLTDRPARDAGSMSPKQFVENWSKWGFEEVPPNAAILGSDVDAVVELNEPKVKGQRIRFQIAEEIRGARDQGTLGSVSLFIDSSYGNCTVVINNGLPNDLTLTSYDPTDASRWGGGTPPQTVPGSTEVSVDFKFLSDTNARPATMVYTYHGYIDVQLTMNWTCKYSNIGPNVEGGGDCEPNVYDGPNCSAETRDSGKIAFNTFNEP